jgi:hypothetical protein
LLALGAGAVVAAAAVVAVVLTQGTDDPGPSGGGDSPAGAFSQTSPWRLQLEDHTSDDGGGDDGCDLRLTGGDEAIDMPVHFFGTVTYQMRVSGSFRWDANRRGCLAVALPGRGPVYSGDFSWPSGTGDSAVFESPGTVVVRVTEEGRTSSCDLDLRSDVDGHSIRSKEVPADQSSVRFATDGPERVYLADVTCGVSVSTPDD